MSDIEKYDWSEWRPFPNPTKKGILVSPFGFGVYQLRNNNTNEFVYCGKGNGVSYRMSSLLPKPYGHGTRNNMRLRNYVWENLDDIDYRTLTCDNEDESKEIERRIKQNQRHLFHT